MYIKYYTYHIIMYNVLKLYFYIFEKKKIIPTLQIYKFTLVNKNIVLLQTAFIYSIDKCILIDG